MATTGLLKTMGISLNILTVSGLIVAMGRVIDDTIVILDNIYRKAHESRAKPNAVLLSEAVMEMAPAIISSTATTVAVYIPIALIGGMISSAFFRLCLVRCDCASDLAFGCNVCGTGTLSSMAQRTDERFGDFHRTRLAKNVKLGFSKKKKKDPRRILSDVRHFGYGSVFPAGELSACEPLRAN